MLGFIQLIAPVVGVLRFVMHIVAVILNLDSGQSGQSGMGEAAGVTEANGRDEDPEESRGDDQKME